MLFIWFIWFLLSLSFCFFFFKQKTAYEMRISDWSSDVCSSDLFFLILSVQSKILRWAGHVFYLESTTFPLFAIDCNAHAAAGSQLKPTRAGQLQCCTANGKRTGQHSSNQIGRAHV